MRSWWMDCPICGEPTQAGGRTRWERAYRWLVRQPFFDWLNLPVPNVHQVERVCATHGKVVIHKLKHGPTHCQQCGYDLRTCQGDACPECGWTMPPSMRDALAEGEA